MTQGKFKRWAQCLAESPWTKLIALEGIRRLLDWWLNE